MSKTPETDAAFKRAAYKVDDDMSGSRTEYEIGKIKEDMRSIETRLRQAEADLAHERKRSAGLEGDRTELQAKVGHFDHACLLVIHCTVHSWDEVPVINERDQWTVKRVKELLLAYQAATKEAA